MDNLSLFDNDEISTESGNRPVSSGRQIDVVEMSFVGADIIDWQELFDGYERIHAITYSSGITFACELISLFNYAEIIFGCEEVMAFNLQEIMAYQEKTVVRLRETASQTKINLLDRIDADTLKLYVARKKLSHEKLYLLEAEDGRKRVVMGSANMSYSAFSGRQRENICYIDGEKAYDWYMDCYNSLKQDSVDSIDSKALVSVGVDENARELPVMKTINIKKAMVITPDKESGEDAKFILDVRNLAKKYSQHVPQASKNGKITLSPDVMVRTRRRIIQAEEREKDRLKEYPHLIIDTENQRVLLNGKELDLNPSDEEIKNDVQYFLEYMEGFSRFHGDVDGMKNKYYAFANWFFLSPMLALMRRYAVDSNQTLLPYPVFGLVYGMSKAGKTSFLETLLMMMIGQKPTLSATDFTRTNIDSLRRSVEGAPIIVDDLTQQRFSQHGVEIIKNENFGTDTDSMHYPAVVISANEDVKAVTPEVARRTVLCHVRAGLTNTELMQSNIVRKVQANIKTALYRKYLGLMLSRLPEMIDEINDEEAKHPPDILNVSSFVLRDLLAGYYGEPLPDYVRVLTLEDYFSEKVTRATLVTTIQKAWTVNKKAFTINAKLGELRYNAGASYEANRMLKELPEDLEAHKVREVVIMNLDKACEFFETDFRKGKGLFRFFGR